MPKELLRQKIERKLPTDITSARSEVLGIRGASYYIPHPWAPLNEVDAKLDLMVDDIIQELDAMAMVPILAYYTGMSIQIADQFFSKKERKPYRSHITFSDNEEERRHQILSVGIYLREKYFEINNVVSEEDQAKYNQAKNRLRTYFEYSLAYLFYPEVSRLDDMAGGIDKESREVGLLWPNSEMSQIFHEEIDQAASLFKIDRDTLEKEVMTATEKPTDAKAGNFMTIEPYLVSHQVSPAVRQVLENILKRRAGDKKLNREKLKLLWQTTVYTQRMGIDLETYYELHDWPTGDLLKQRLEGYLTDPEKVKDVWKHIKNETGRDDWGNNTAIDYWDIMAARAKVGELPSGTEDIDHLNLKVNNLIALVRSNFPVAFDEKNPYINLFIPTVQVVPMRPVTVTHPNESGETVSYCIINPRTDDLVLLQRILHEQGGHALHFYLLALAEKNGILRKGSINRINPQISETFAMMIEEQANVLLEKNGEKNDQTNKQAEGGIYPDLYKALRMRHQAAFALTAQAVREEMERRWNKGIRHPLTDEEADIITNKLSEDQVQKSHMLGIPIQQPHQGLWNNFDPARPHDGFVYIKSINNETDAKTTTGTKEISTNETIDFKEAFLRKFGKKWITNRNAKVVLLHYMVKSGKDEVNISLFGKEIVDLTPADIDHMIYEVESLGIKNI